MNLLKRHLSQPLFLLKLNQVFRSRLQGSNLIKHCTENFMSQSYVDGKLDAHAHFPVAHNTFPASSSFTGMIELANF